MLHKGVYRASARSKIQSFLTIANGYKSLVIVAKCSMKDVCNNPGCTSARFVKRILSFLFKYSKYPLNLFTCYKSFNALTPS